MPMQPIRKCQKTLASADSSYLLGDFPLPESQIPLENHPKHTQNQQNTSNLPPPPQIYVPPRTRSLEFTLKLAIHNCSAHTVQSCSSLFNANSHEPEESQATQEQQWSICLEVHVTNIIRTLFTFRKSGFPVTDDITERDCRRFLVVQCVPGWTGGVDGCPDRGR